MMFCDDSTRKAAYLKRSFSEVKRTTIRAAKELKYDEDILDDLQKANTEEELTSIMTKARKREE